MSNHSESINEIAAALAKAQGQIKAAEKDGRNPHFNSTYATLSSVWEACRAALSANGLALTQIIFETETGPALETILVHSSGQWFKSIIKIPSASNNRGVTEVQAMGSSLTYLRRYAMAAIVGIVADDDDDGNLAKSKPAQAQQQPPKPAQPAANSGKKLAGDAVTVYWSKARELKIEQPVAAQILKNNGGDAVKAYDELIGVTQPPLVEVDPPQGVGAAYDESGPA